MPPVVHSIQAGRELALPVANPTVHTTLRHSSMSIKILLYTLIFKEQLVNYLT